MLGDRTSPCTCDAITADKPSERPTTTPANNRTIESTTTNNAAKQLRASFDIVDNGWVRTSQLLEQQMCDGERRRRDRAQRFLRLADFEGNGRIDYEMFLARMSRVEND